MPTRGVVDLAMKAVRVHFVANPSRLAMNIPGRFSSKGRASTEGHRVEVRPIDRGGCSHGSTRWHVRTPKRVGCIGPSHPGPSGTRIRRGCGRSSRGQPCPARVGAFPSRWGVWARPESRLDGARKRPSSRASPFGLWWANPPRPIAACASSIARAGPTVGNEVKSHGITI